MVAGTMSTRTKVASSATASARPTPIALTTTTRANANAMNAVTMIAAALVISRPLRSRPSATARVVSPVRRYSSFMRASISTS